MPSDAADAKEGPGDRQAAKPDNKGLGTSKFKRTPADEESRRFLKWYSFARANMSFGFEHLPPVAVPSMVEDRTGYAVRFEKITGWSIPAGILKAITAIQEDVGKYDYKLQLSMSMYHLSSNTFFGSTWMGTPVVLNPSIFNITESTTVVPVEEDPVMASLRQSRGKFYGASATPEELAALQKAEKEKEKKTKTVTTKTILSRVVDVDYQDIVYMISRITDPSCVAVIEVVLTKVNKDNKLAVAQYGCGWTMINLFQKPLPVDVADDRENMKLLSVNLFAGSPRDLAMFKDAKKLAEKLKILPDCQLFLKTYTHRKLLRASRYFSENAPIGRFDPVGGLVCREVVLPNATKATWLSCLGDEERVDPGSGVHIYPAKPRLALPLMFKIANCQLFIPKRDSLEVRLIESLHHVFPSDQKKSSIRILSRVLKVALHNGHTIVGNHWHTQQLKEDKDDRDILLTSDAVIQLPGYIPDPHMVIVFLIEFCIGIMDEVNNHIDPKALMSSVNELPKPALTSTGLLGAGVYAPFDGKCIFLTNTGRPEGSTEGVDVEIKLFKDESSSILTPLPILKDSKLDNEDAADGKDPTSRLSYMRDSKAGGLLDAKGGPATVNNTQQEEDDMTPMLGFDIRLFHPKKGELKNLDAVDELNRLEEKEGVASSAMADVDEDHVKEERNLKDLDVTPPTVGSKFRKQGPSVIRESDRKFIRRKDDDDDMSVNESIVTGDSEQSNLRLDPYFYTSLVKKQQKTLMDIGDAGSEFSDPVSMQGDRIRGRESGIRQDSLLYLHSMNAKLESNQPADLPIRPTRYRVEPATADMNIAPKTVVPTYGNDHFVREISRGAKSRLNRHGIQDAIADSAYHAVQEFSNEVGMPPSRKSLPVTSKKPMDLELEIYDELNLHEINIQFAGFRPRLIGEGMEAEPSFQMPRCVYFSFQFFTCAPTRTEPLRLLQGNEPGEVNVFVRDDPQVRDQPPMVLRYIIDCSRSTPLEALEFADYLAHKSLYVDLWDADGLVHLGTFGIPLRMLMRQGDPMVKHAVECDVINAEIAAPTDGGVTSLVVVDKGPITGEIIGSVSVVLSNYGNKGNGPNKLMKRDVGYGSAPIIPIEGLNWRAHGIDDPHRHVGNGPNNHRPKNIVRAKPLAEKTPELSKALEDVRQMSSSGGASYRSLATNRGAGGNSTLNYDEVVILFKRFQGTTKGTVQYAGNLMNLLDLPSLSVVLKKLVKAFRQYGDASLFKVEMLRFANAGEEMKQADVEEFLRVLFERTSVKNKEEERTLLSQKIMEEHGQQGYIKASKFVAFCSEEADRQDWTMVNHRLKLCAQKAELEGFDVEQMLADFDPTGTNYISTRKFRDFLTKLASFGKLLQADITLCCRYFSRHSRGLEDRDSVSLAEVMAALGKEYVGNLQARIQKTLQKNIVEDSNGIEAKYVIRLLNDGKENTSNASSSTKGYSYEQVESALRSLGVLVDLSSSQVKSVIRKIDSNNTGRITAVQVLTFLNIKFTASEIQQAEKANGIPPLSARNRSSSHLNIDTKFEEEADAIVDAEFLLRLLLEKVQKNGVAVDHAFRHFDTNGDGFISKKELEEGLRGLSIFDSIPQWTSQLPAIVAKFDKSGDGQVSLREFFNFLGIKDYAPNIIQRLTKIFAIATQKGLSFQDIFIELDEDKNGKLDANEIVQGLNKLGTFGEVTLQDAESVVAQFDDNGDKRVSVNEFITFFSTRVKQDIEQRRQKHIDKVVQRFKDVMNVAQGKGASIADIFSHFDKDRGGSVSTQELATALKSLPNFKTMSNQDIDDLITAMDSNRSGEVSLDEFDRFINGDTSTGTGTSTKASTSLSIFDQIRETFAAAEARGLSFEQTFSLIDKDRSGRLTMNELEKLLKKVPAFKSISVSDVKKLFDMIDTDKSGLVSVEEFKEFVTVGREGYLKHKQELREEEEQKKKRSEAIKTSPRGLEDTPQFGARRGRSDVDDRDGRAGRTMEEKLDLFLRHIRRISEIDGSVRGLLAYLDDDEDGLISRARFFNLLRREDVFDSLSEQDIDQLIEHCYSKDREQIQLTVLLHFLENEGRMMKKNMRGLTYHDLMDGEQEEESKQASLVEQHYEFSRDMEIHAVEKKMRSFGRILAKKGVDVEKHFHQYDARRTGCVLRTDFIKVLSSLGMYLLEEGKVLQDGNTITAGGSSEKDIKQLQIAQIKRLKGSEGTYLLNAPRLARKFYDHPSNGNVGDFKGHLESMTIIDWYRQSQKQMLLQHVLSHSLAHHINIFPRFGKTLFFEYPIYNPFNHEERFEIEISDPELRLVTSFDEWQHLRRVCKPCVGELGSDPIEAEMFDRDGSGKVQVTLLPHETLYVPFTFMTLIPHIPPSRHNKTTTSSSSRYGNDNDSEDKEEALRRLDVKIISGSHGNIVAVLKVNLFPRPFVIDRVLRFHEFENTIAKRRIKLTGIDPCSSSGSSPYTTFPGDFAMNMKFIHCVESTASPEVNSRVVVEWGSALQGGGYLPAGRHGHPHNIHNKNKKDNRDIIDNDTDWNSIEMLIRYRCGESPGLGMFYLLIYNDPYQSELHEIWQVVMHSRLRLDVHGTVGTVSAADLVIRGDQYPRRVRAFASTSQAQFIRFKPENVFQLVANAYNRVMTTIQPKYMGNRRALVNVVDVDSRELLSAWLVSIQASAPAVMRTYDVEVEVGKPTFKKILFKNPWDVRRTFVVSSSDEGLLRPRTSSIEVGPFGAAYLRLWINGWQRGSTGIREVHLFMNDAEEGHSEECHLFRIREANNMFNQG